MIFWVRQTTHLAFCRIMLQWATFRLWILGPKYAALFWFADFPYRVQLVKKWLAVQAAVARVVWWRGKVWIGSWVLRHESQEPWTWIVEPIRKNWKIDEPWTPRDASILDPNHGTGKTVERMTFAITEVPQKTQNFDALKAMYVEGQLTRGDLYVMVTLTMPAFDVNAFLDEFKSDRKFVEDFAEWLRQVAGGAAMMTSGQTYDLDDVSREAAHQARNRVVRWLLVGDEA